MKPEDKIKDLIHGSDVTTDPQTDKRILGDAMEYLDKLKAQESSRIQPGIWGTIKSPIGKFAAAAVIIMSAWLLVTFIDRGVTPAYAFEHTIEANHSIETIHLRIITGEGSIENRELSDCWIKYNAAGFLSNSRWNLHDENGVRFAVWNEGVSKTWLPEKNVVIVIRVNNMDTELEEFAEKFDPKLILQRLYDESQKNVTIALEIDEPANEGNPIHVNAVKSVEKTRVELVVDPATKLVKEFSEYRLGEPDDELDMRIKFLAYNQPIDPAVFELSGIPDDALIIDCVDQLVGLERGDLTDNEIAVKVVRECLEAVIAGDYEEASRLMEGAPGETIEEFINEEFNARLVRVVSIGQPEPHDEWTFILCVPCEIEVENEEREKRLENITAMAKPIGYQPGFRWIVHNALQVSEPHIPSTSALEAQDRIEENRIVPKVGVGDYTLGMSKEEVLRTLGEPTAICYQGERYTLNNLPENYYLFFGDISFAMVNGLVKGIAVHGPLYKCAGGLGVGDSEQKIKQVFGNDFQLVEGEWKEFLIYDDEGVEFEIHKTNRTIIEINVFQPEPELSDGGDASTPSSLEPFDEVSGKDLRALDLRHAGDFLDTLGFNQETLWPTPDRLPEGFNPKALLQEGMNPGLGVWALHAAGITGAGVHVGLIDQPLLLDHPEYDGKIVSYHKIDCGSSKSSMHGPGMACQLVGRRCGTAPGASLHVVAVPSWKADAGYYARALDRFVAYNETVPEDRKIRVVSVSSQPSGKGSEYKNQSLWDRAVQRAQAKGVLVLDCTWHHGFVSLCWLDPQNRERVESCTPGFRDGIVEVDDGHIHVPSAPRTTAEAYEDKPFGYAYDGGGRRSSRPASKGGYSDTIPYAAGVLALGWQIRPDISPVQMKEMLFASAYVHESGAKIIHPTAFIKLIRNQNGNQRMQTHPQTYSGNQTIIPGMGVGDFTFGMSKKDVLEILGKTKRGSIKQLEDRIIVDDLVLFITDDSVIDIAVLSDRYNFANGLGVGDTEEKIREAFGINFKLHKGGGKDFLRYEDKGLSFEIHKKNRTVMEINVSPAEDDQGDGETRYDFKLKMTLERLNEPLTLPRIERHPPSDLWKRGKIEGLPDSISDDFYQVDLRNYDLSGLDLSKNLFELLNSEFSTNTKWPSKGKLPPGFDVNGIMEYGMDPGLNVRSLHQKGITGKNVGIAIIDQVLLTKHEQYADRLQFYEEYHVLAGRDADSHGTGCASVALGSTIGVAPEADLYYIATYWCDWKDGEMIPNFTYLATAVRRIIELNSILPENRNIKVLSIARGFTPGDLGYKEVADAILEAIDSGIFVIPCSPEIFYDDFDFMALGRDVMNDPNDIESFRPVNWIMDTFISEKDIYDEVIFVPSGSRVNAFTDSIDSYEFSTGGGLSSVAPYVAGVYALAKQVKPEIEIDEFIRLLNETARSNMFKYEGKKYTIKKMINPVGVINRLNQ